VRFVLRVLKVVGFGCLCPLLLHSAPVPGLNLSQLVGGADVIVAGSLLAIEDSGTTYADVSGSRQVVHQMTGPIQIGVVLKGTAPIPALTLRWILPEESYGYTGVPEHIYRLIFLHRSGSTYGLASVYYPTLPAIPGIKMEGATALDRVINQLAAVVHSGAGNAQDRIEAINALGTVENLNVTSTLRDVLSDRARSVQLQAATVLLEHNDISALPLAEATLSRPRSDVSPYLVHNLLYAISGGVRDEKAIPGLSRLVKSRDVETRRSAASALRNTGSRLAIDPLIAALGDEDFEVRYYSAIGLAEITGQNEWRPLMEEFKKNEQKYLAHWRNSSNWR
jgi:HEAT repeat protein